jgi:hypothetical protein
MPIVKTMTKMRIALLELVTASGSAACRNGGSGWEPITLSTAIFSGNGVSSDRGVDNKVTNRSPPRCR